MSEMAFWRRPRIDHSEAEAARARAEVAKRRVAARQSEVNAVTMALRKMREENHLHERLVATIRGI